MKIIARKINLNPREKTNKKVDKYSETSPTKNEYRFSLKEQVRYIGLLEEYNGLECTIVKRSRRKMTEFYGIKFDNDEIVNDVSGAFLKALAEYEQYLIDSENDEDNQSDMSEFEIELMKQGLESYKNYVQCLSPIDWHHMACDRCGYKDRCVCRKKNKYKKVD